jgi:hypothetical protein
MWLKLAIVAAVVWWIFIRKANATGVIQGTGEDFDSVTADQLSGQAMNGGPVPVGSVDVGDWSASFTEGNGNWSDAYRSHANEDDMMLNAMAGGA